MNEGKHRADISTNYVGIFRGRVEEALTDLLADAELTRDYGFAGIAALNTVARCEGLFRWVIEAAITEAIEVEKGDAA